MAPLSYSLVLKAQPFLTLTESQFDLSADKTDAATENLDPSLIFTFLFGNDSFNDIVGRFQGVTNPLVVEGAECSPLILEPTEGGELGWRRVVRLALALRE